MRSLPDAPLTRGRPPRWHFGLCICLLAAPHMRRLDKICATREARVARSCLALLVLSDYVALSASSTVTFFAPASPHLPRCRKYWFCLQSFIGSEYDEALSAERASPLVPKEVSPFALCRVAERSPDRLTGQPARLQCSVCTGAAPAHGSAKWRRVRGCRLYDFRPRGEFRPDGPSPQPRLGGPCSGTACRTSTASGACDSDARCD